MTDLVEKPKEPEKNSETMSSIESALAGIKGNVEVAKEVGTKIKKLYEMISEISFSKIFEQFKGLFGMTFIDALSPKKKGEEKKEDKTVRVIDNNEDSTEEPIEHEDEDKEEGHSHTEKPETESGNNRVLKYPISEEAKRMNYLSRINPSEALVKNPYYYYRYSKKTGKYHPIRFETKETVKAGLKLANEFAKKDGYQILILSGYRDPNLQAKLKKKNKEKRGNTNKWVAPPGESWHQAGAAGDMGLFPLDGNKSTDKLTAKKNPKRQFYYAKMEEYLNAAGFVRYDAEPWHFEIGSIGWAKIMKEQGLIPQNVPLDQITYKKDKLGQPSGHRRDHQLLA